MDKKKKTVENSTLPVCSFARGHKRAVVVRRRRRGPADNYWAAATLTAAAATRAPPARGRMRVRAPRTYPVYAMCVVHDACMPVRPSVRPSVQRLHPGNSRVAVRVRMRAQDHGNPLVISPDEISTPDRHPPHTRENCIFLMYVRSDAMGT
ncbi:Hypothetical protein CINCED_3A000611 [Cinara cedri]|uniref:Uncharacterized protein n=1 Tax=Cinara cedri TaxID=506608 RepID=A0A5E4NF75_9HEMI|nr:Hypothetical protein CINCED_3A000611 [Cinara cedri]